MKALRPFLVLAGLALATGASAADGAGPDPLASPQWGFMHESILNGEPVVFDSRVLVMAPASAEDAMNVPVAVRAEGLDDIETIVVFADLNPIHRVLNFYPLDAEAALAFRVKIEQATPIRAAARTADGVWHVGGAWVDAAGGGCTAPSYGRESGTWYETLGQVRHRVWKHGEDAVERLRFQVMHPMDTGLAPGIPAFYIERLDLRNEAGELKAYVELFEPVSENPYLTFDFADRGEEGALVLSGRDINGNRVEKVLD